MGRKSSSCFTSEGKPRSEYETEWEAQQSADYQRSANGIDLYPYPCTKCGKFHLAPVESKINVVNFNCGCTDSNGRKKELYETRDDAQKVADARMKKGSGPLFVYPCESRRGFHLTHKNQFYI